MQECNITSGQSGLINDMCLKVINPCRKFPCDLRVSVYKRRFRKNNVPCRVINLSTCFILGFTLRKIFMLQDFSLLGKLMNLQIYLWMNKPVKFKVQNCYKTTLHEVNVKIFMHILCSNILVPFQACQCWIINK